MKNATVTPNLLTFDIEGFVESSHDSMHVPEKYVSEQLEAEEIEINTLEILSVLAESNQKATFFILGRIARDMPRLVKQIADDGHEIGCHSFHHRRLFQFQEREVRQFLSDAKRYLEDSSGKPVIGFRAPDFSIGKQNLWVFDVLRDLSFRYDSSVVSTSLHDVYGIPGFPSAPFVLPNGLIEIPISTVKVFGLGLPVGGGGYLRLYPLFLTEFLLTLTNRKGIPGVVYLHPFEMAKRVRRIDEMSRLRRFRTYVGLPSAKRKLMELIERYHFIPMNDYVQERFATGTGA